MNSYIVKEREQFLMGCMPEMLVYPLVWTKAIPSPGVLHEGENEDGQSLRHF